MYSEKQNFSLVHNLNYVLSSVRHSTCTSCCILMSLVNFYEVKYSTTGWRESAFTETHAYLKYIPEVWNERGRSESCSNLTVPWTAIRKHHVRKKTASEREQRNDKQTLHEINLSANWTRREKNRMRTHRRSASKLDNITNMLKLGS